MIFGSIFVSGKALTPRYFETASIAIHRRLVPCSDLIERYSVPYPLQRYVSLRVAVGDDGILSNVICEKAPYI